MTAAPKTQSALLPIDLVPARVRKGDLWQVGRHRLLCGDCTDPAQVAKLMQGERATLTVTSPPYNMGEQNAFPDIHHGCRPGAAKYRFHHDALPKEQYRTLLQRATENALAVSEIVIVNAQMLAGNKVVLLEWLYGFREDLIDVAVWDKGSAVPAMPKNVFNSRFEFLVFLTRHRSKGKTPRTIFTADFRGTVDNIYNAPPQRGNQFFHLHAATFPMHLPTWLMNTFD